MTQSIESVREALAGRNSVIETPFGPRSLVYADYVASGRPLATIDAAVDALCDDYANPHTEDSALARSTRTAMRQAEASIRKAVNAAAEDVLVPCGAGATAAIHHLQQILGIACPPATRAFLDEAVRAALGADSARVEAEIARRRPVVFVGPYEHHSNELSWRESLAEVVRIGLDASGGIDLDELETRLADPAYAGRRKIGAFSAASNVTGLKTGVAALARLLHAHGAILCLDAAASAPYARIDMHPVNDPEARIDAVYFSPHKFLGGPGACGILVFDAALYRGDLAPTVSGGGTVRYVTATGHDFIEAAEPRERAGTPGVPQLVRAGHAMALLDAVGYETIEAREHTHLERAFARWQDDERIEILGPPEPERRLAIVSFNLKDAHGRRVPPRLVATLLSDLFGIQARSGCACAGPYGHDLLGLGEQESEAARQAVLAGDAGARPGWCRVSLHWVLDEDELDYLIEAICFLALHAPDFAELYSEDRASGAWRLHSEPEPALMPDAAGPAALRQAAFTTARAMLDRLRNAA